MTGATRSMLNVRILSLVVYDETVYSGLTKSMLWHLERGLIVARRDER
jgi:hypothetical protein